jgi:hypothetical protein
MRIRMASMPSILSAEQPPNSSVDPEGQAHANPQAAAASPGHKERVRASLSWALNEYADTLEKLAK